MYTISKDGFGGADPASEWTNGNGVRWLESPEYPLSGDLGDLIYVKECTDSKLNVLVSSLNDRLAQFQAEFGVTYDPFGDPTPTNNVSDNYWTSSEKDKDNARTIRKEAETEGSFSVKSVRVRPGRAAQKKDAKDVKSI